jgi:hypothetical protein
MVRKIVRCSRMIRKSGNRFSDKIMRKQAGVTRSFLSQSSDLHRRPVVMPAGRIAGAARERR